MKVKVLKKFKDKHTKKLRTKGEVFECTEERFNEICEKDKTLVEAVEESFTEGEEFVCDIAQLSKKELMELAAQKGIELKETMKKEEMLAALQ